MRKIETLSLSYNDLTDLPASIGNLPNLKTLDLDYNRLNHVPDVIEQIASLQELTIDRNPVTDIPEWMAQDVFWRVKGHPFQFMGSADDAFK